MFGSLAMVSSNMILGTLVFSI